MHSNVLKVGSIRPGPTAFVPNLSAAWHALLLKSYRRWCSENGRRLTRYLASGTLLYYSSHPAITPSGFPVSPNQISRFQQARHLNELAHWRRARNHIDSLIDFMQSVPNVCIWPSVDSPMRPNLSNISRFKSVALVQPRAKGLYEHFLVSEWLVGIS